MPTLTTRRLPILGAALLLLGATACGGGGAGGGAGPSTEGTVGASAPSPLGAVLTDEGRFGVLVAGAEPMTAVVLTTASGEQIRFVGLFIEPGELWEEPAPGEVGPGTYVVRTYGVSGWTYARPFVFIPGLAEAPYVSNANLEIESIDPDFTFDPDFAPGPGGRQVP